MINTYKINILIYTNSGEKMLNVFEYMSKIQESIEEKNEGLGELYKISMMKLSNEVKPTS